MFREKVRNDTGYVRHHLLVHVLSIGWDDSKEDELSDVVEDVCEEMVDDYNGKVSIFAAGLPTKTIVRAKARRESPMDSKNKRANRRKAVVKIEVDEFEA